MVIAGNWRGKWDIAIRVSAVAVAVIALLTVVPAGATARNFIDESRDGQGGKEAAAATVFGALKADAPALVLGLGPAESVSRAAFMTTPLLLQRGLPAARPRTEPGKARREGPNRRVRRLGRRNVVQHGDFERAGSAGRSRNCRDAHLRVDDRLALHRATTIAAPRGSAGHLRARAVRGARPRLRLVGATTVWDRGRASRRTCDRAAFRNRRRRPRGHAHARGPRANALDPGPTSGRRGPSPLRILVLHSRYLSGSTSGENRVVDDEIELLRSAGTTFVSWTPSVTETKPVRAAVNAIWSVDEASNVRRLITLHRPDVVHIHNLFPQLSPLVIRAAASRGVPTLVTLHNFRLMCLPATFLRDGKTCEACAGNVPWRGVVHGCYRGSRPASMVLASSLMVHRGARTFDRVGLFLAVSDFVRSAYVRHGIDSTRIRVKSNFAWPQPRRRGQERVPRSRTAFSGEGGRHGNCGCRRQWFAHGGRRRSRA